MCCYMLLAHTPSGDCLHTDILAYARVSAALCSGCCVAAYSSCCHSAQGTQAARQPGSQAAQVYVPMQNRLMSSTTTTTTAKAAGQQGNRAAIRVVAIAAVAAVYKIFFAVHINQGNCQSQSKANQSILYFILCSLLLRSM